ncbi:hypothetical protein Tco_0874220 [Tanacetum coccineum]|uniref:Aminotransferase-like plant mobile domain-containing protein n=1 Tax=Tanacetum coccineum TaxID=301880 RepID=A0ABQ5BMP4_9ASTR
MASESTSSQQSQQLILSSKLIFRCRDSIIGFNNAVAPLEHSNKLYRPMLSFLLNYCINRALTLQTTTMYVEYLKEIWYTAKVEEETKTITFLLSRWDKPLSFTQDEFISAIGLPICRDVIPLSPKETVRAGLVTLGLFDKDKPTLSSTVLINSSSLKIKYFSPIWKLFMQYIIKCLGRMQGSHDQMNLNQQIIAYCLIWGLEIDAGGIIFSDLVHKLQNGKKNRELNICYTRFLSLIFEKLLGRDYVSNNLTLVKPHTITAASFQKPLASEVPLTSHMLKVAKLSKEPEQSLIPPSGEVNTDDTADKYLSRASVQHVTQFKATTDLKIKKKKIPPSSKPKSPYKVRVILPKKQVTKTQQAEVTVATTDATKSLVASELEEEQGNQLSAAEAEKVLDQNVEEEKDAEFMAMEEVAEEQSLKFPIVEKLLDEADKLNKAVQETPECPYDTKSKIKVLKSFLTNHISKQQDQTMHDSKETTDIHEDSDSDLQSMPDDDLGSVSGLTLLTLTILTKMKCLNLTTFSQMIMLPLNVSVFQIIWIISMKKSALFIQNLGIWSLLLFNKSQLQSSHLCQPLELPHIEAQVHKNLQDQLPNLLLKPMYKEFNAFNKLESQRFVLLQKELSKSLHKNMRKSIKLKVIKGMKEVRDKLSFCTSTVATNSQHVQDLREKDAQHPDQTKGEQILRANTADIVQGEQPSAQVVTNEEKSLVVHNIEEMKSEGTISMKDDLDDDELDKKPLSKIFKIMTPILNPIPLNTFIPGHLLKPEEQQKSLQEFTDQLFGTTSSKFSPTPPREPTPHRDPAKGKEVSIVKEQVNELVTYQEEGGSILKMPKLKSFITLEGTLSQEEFNNKIKELKRISDLKAQKDKSEQELRKMFNQATLKAQAKKWTEHEAKKAKILEEYCNISQFQVAVY